MRSPLPESRDDVEMECRHVGLQGKIWLLLLDGRVRKGLESVASGEFLTGYHLHQDRDVGEGS